MAKFLSVSNRDEYGYTFFEIHLQYRQLTPTGYRSLDVPINLIDSDAKDLCHALWHLLYGKDCPQELSDEY